MVRHKLGKLLSFWWMRISLFLLFSLVLISIISFVLSHISSILFYESIRFSFTYAVALLAVSCLIECYRKGSRFWAFGIRFDRFTFLDISTGFLISTVSIFAISLISLLFGANIYYPRYSSIIDTLINNTLIVFFSVMTEELIFRGIVFLAIRDKYGNAVAIIVLTIIFVLIHNPSNEIFITNLIIGNILMSIMFIRTNSLWMPFSFHFFWNFLQATFFSQSVSGNLYSSSIMFVKQSSDYQWLTGGMLGLEFGLLATIFLILSIPIVLRFGKESPFLASVLFRRRHEESAA